MVLLVGRKQIPTQIDPEDAMKVTETPNLSLSVTSHGYVGVSIYLGRIDGKYKYRRTYVHRLITKAPRHLEVDHINGDKLDNRKINLRVCNRGNNARNIGAQRNGQSHFRGVWPSGSGRWVAQITYKYKTEHLGTFDTEDEAARAYNKASKKLHGKYGRINQV